MDKLTKARKLSHFASFADKPNFDFVQGDIYDCESVSVLVDNLEQYVILQINPIGTDRFKILRSPIA